MTGQLLHLHQASQAWQDTDTDTRKDLERSLERGAVLVGYTEVSPANGNLAILRDVARDRGYRVLWGPTENHPGAETAIAVQDGAEVLDHGAVLLADAVRGGYSARYATWCRVAWEGEDVFHVVAHWVTGFTRKESRRIAHEAISQKIADLVQEHGKGVGLAFFGGDVNQNEETDRGQNPRAAHAILTAGHLTTCWDELGVYPSTHGGPRGGTLDVIGSFDLDRRVKAEAVQVYTDRTSDHMPFSAWYRVGDRKAAPVAPAVPEAPHACPACGDVHLRPAR